MARPSSDHASVRSQRIAGLSGRGLTAALAVALFALTCKEAGGTDPEPPDGIYEIALAADSAQTGHDWIYAVRSDGSGWRLVSSAYPTVGPVSWSPDGLFIAVAAYAPDQQIAVLPRAGGPASLSLPTTHTQFSWSPGTSVLYFSKSHVFSSDPWNARAAIFSASSSGSPPTLLTSDTMDCLWPAVSPDGLTIAFVGRGNGDAANRLYLMTNDGSNVKRRSTREPVAIGWSPASDWIWFMTADGTWKVRADGSITVPLSASPIIPSWSPDGISIAYSFESEIFVMSADGGVPHNLTDPSNAPGTTGIKTAPRWSPDGRTISYLVTGSADGSGLWTMKSDGSSQRRIAAAGHPRSQDWSRRTAP